MDPLTITFGLLALALAIVAALLLRRTVSAEAARDLAVARLGDQASTKQTFEALAAESLRAAQRDLVKTSTAVLESQRAAGRSELDARRTQIDALIKPLGEALERTKHELEKAGKRSDSLEGTLAAMRNAQGDLRAETRQLSQALRRPNVRGRYGEVQLERVVELAGMRSYCDFDVQSSLGGAGTDPTQRPDMIVHLPNGRSVVVDAKVPIDAYLDASSAETEEDQLRHLATYGKAVLAQVRKLGKKEYWKHFQPAPEFVVMFLPGEQFVDAALRAEATLIDEAAKSNVLLASPSSLIGLLRAVHVGWREQSLTESAEELFALGRELHDRASTVLRHASDMGTHIERTRVSYNKFVGSVEGRLLPTLRRFEEKGAHSEKKLTAPKEIVDGLRSFNSDLELEPAPPALPARKAKSDRQDAEAEGQHDPALPAGADQDDRDPEAH